MRLLEVWLEEFLRANGAYVGLGDQGRARVYIRWHLLALRRCKRNPDTLIPHAEWVLDDETGDHVIPQKFDKLFIRSKADDVYLVVGVLVGHGLAHHLRHDRI